MPAPLEQQRRIVAATLKGLLREPPEVVFSGRGHPVTIAAAQPEGSPQDALLD
jgi:uncharacterized protein (DUF2336 family)